jgi:hypothetical protein
MTRIICFFPDDQQIRFALKNSRHPRQEAEKCGSGRETGWGEILPIHGKAERVSIRDSIDTRFGKFC